METIENIIRLAADNEAPVKRPWTAHEFDNTGKPLDSGFRFPFQKRGRTLLVNTAVRVEYNYALRVPDRDTECLHLKIKFKMECPHQREAAVARALYHRIDPPKVVLDRYLYEEINSWFYSYGQDRLLSDLSQALRNLENYLADHLRTRSSLEITRVSAQLTTVLEPRISISFDKTPVDLANNCRGFPIQLVADLEIDSSNPRAYGLAHWRMDGGAKLHTELRARILEYFRQVSLQALFEEHSQVETALRKSLNSAFAPVGRVVTRLVVGLPDWGAIPQKINPIRESFTCALRDGTGVTVVVEGGIHVQDFGKYMDPGDWKNQPDPWPKLLVTLKDRAGSELGRSIYSDIRNKLDQVSERILAPVREEAARFGAHLDVRTRFEWPFEWLWQPVPVHRDIECKVGRARVDCKFSIRAEVALVDSSPLGGRPSDQEQFMSLLGAEMERCAETALMGCSLAEYFAFEVALKQRIEREIEGGLRLRFGVEVRGLQMERIDDSAAITMMTIIKKAPDIRVAHPKKPDLTFSGKFRVTDYVATSGPSVQPFPSSISEIESLVVNYIRQILNESPAGLVYGQVNQQILRELLTAKLRDTMLHNHALEIQLMTWIPDQPAEYLPLDGELRTLMDRLRKARQQGFPESDLEELRNQISEIASEMSMQGEAVPWENLRALKIECPEAPKQLPASDTKELPEPPKKASA